MKIQTITVIPLNEWNKLVTETYGRQYNLQQQDDCLPQGNLRITVPGPPEDFARHSVPEVVNHEEMGVSFAAWLARDPKQPLPGQKADYELRLWWDRNFYPSLQMVANDLHAKGLLDAGDHTINIDW